MQQIFSVAYLLSISLSTDDSVMTVEWYSISRLRHFPIQGEMYVYRHDDFMISFLHKPIAIIIVFSFKVVGGVSDAVCYTNLCTQSADNMWMDLSLGKSRIVKIVISISPTTC